MDRHDYFFSMSSGDFVRLDCILRVREESQLSSLPSMEKEYHTRHLFNAWDVSVNTVACRIGSFGEVSNNR
jgi:hypothetical protein